MIRELCGINQPGIGLLINGVLLFPSQRYQYRRWHKLIPFRRRRFAIAATLGISWTTEPLGAMILALHNTPIHHNVKIRLFLHHTSKPLFHALKRNTFLNAFLGIMFWSAHGWWCLMIDGDKSFLLQGITGKQDSLELNYYSSLCIFSISSTARSFNPCATARR